MEGIRNEPKSGFELLERSLENNVNALAKHKANPEQFVADELRRVQWKLNERKEFVKKIDLRQKHPPETVHHEFTVHQELREIAQAKRRIAHVPAKSLPKPIFVSITCY